MWRGILGKKLGMTQFFTESGERIGCTVVEAGPCPVLQVKTREKEGYNAIQLGFAPKKEKHASKAVIGHCKRSGNAPMRFVREIRLRGGDEEFKEGDVVSLESWTDVAEVQVTAKSKGKGFQGVMRRHNFHGMKATHGVKTTHRHHGSTGSLTPTRTVKGTKLPGHMGDKWITQKGLKVARVIPEQNLILLRGSVPGPNGGVVVLRPAQPYQPPVS